ncbi:MAG: sialate O-acetylesterase [Planctomycetota bacterium]|nr:sialate O-acetylesterase [Planctomycetota bacterium]
MNVPARLSCILLSLILLPTLASADPTLPAVFSDNMVLQRDKAVPVWGKADPGEKVTVEFAGQSLSATANDKGQWTVTLEKLKTNATGQELKVTGKSGQARSYKNVLVGEVWLCSGQSNMQWTLNRAMNGKAEIAAAKYPLIRLLSVKRTASVKALKNITGRWQPCTPKSAATFSAVGYFFGRHLHKELNVPIGLINSSWGGTRAEAWTKLGALQAQDSLAPLLKHWDKSINTYDVKVEKERFQKALTAWKYKLKSVKKGRRAPRKPRMRWDPALSYHRPGNLYNGMISPLIPFAIKGVVWYQGESNLGRAEQYKTIFPTMIKNWRQDWQQGDFSFYFVQLAPFRYKWGDPSICAELWEAQLFTMKTVKNTGMAVITDIGDHKDIHPKNKHDVGKRLALWALAKDYKKSDVVCSGPIYKAMEVRGNKVVLSFDLYGSKLKSRDGKALTNFKMAGADKKFYPAKARIVGATIEVECDQVPAPKSVRFGWKDTANPNLVNKEGLPASPFRTDQWPALTAGRHH